MGVRREQAYEAVRNLILSGRMPAGQDTSETKLLEMLADRGGMSRTPLREALAILAHTGMIEQKPQIGLYVRPVTAGEVHEILRTRTGLEGVAGEMAGAGGAAGRAEGLEQMQRSVDGAQEVLDRGLSAEGDAQRFGELDTQFHVGLLHAAGLNSASVALAGFRDRLALYRLTDRPLRPEDAQAAIAEHQDILTWVRDKDDPASARRQVVAHLRAAAARLVGDENLCSLVPAVPALVA